MGIGIFLNFPRPFLLLWPWPWTDDHPIQTWPVFSRVVPDVQKWTLYMKAFESHRLTNRHDWNYVLRCFVGGQKYAHFYFIVRLQLQCSDNAGWVMTLLSVIMNYCEYEVWALDLVFRTCWWRCRASTARTFTRLWTALRTCCSWWSWVLLSWRRSSVVPPVLNCYTSSSTQMTSCHRQMLLQQLLQRLIAAKSLQRLASRNRLCGESRLEKSRSLFLVNIIINGVIKDENFYRDSVMHLAFCCCDWQWRIWLRSVTVINLTSFHVAAYIF